MATQSKNSASTNFDEMLEATRQLYSAWIESYRRMMEGSLAAGFGAGAENIAGRESPSAKERGSEQETKGVGPSPSSTFFESFSSAWLSGFDDFVKRMAWFPPFTAVQGTAPVNFSVFTRYLELQRDYLDLFAESLDVFAAFSRIWFEAALAASSEFSQRMQKEVAASGVSTQQGKKDDGGWKMLYNFWMKEVERRTDLLLREDAFSAKLGRILTKSLDLRKRFDELIQGYLSAFGIPTRAELDQLNREVHALKKRVRELNTELESKSKG